MNKVKQTKIEYIRC